jgi:starch-binding outer membrane protein, SusD/RagB family
MQSNSTKASRRASSKPRDPRTRARRRAVLVLVGLISAACYNFNITDPNGPTLQGLSDPTAANVSAAMTGLFSASRQDIQGLIWRVGSMGREAINLSGNNQPDYTEPYFGPLSSTQFGSSSWGSEYAAIRDANILIDGAPKAPDMTAGEKALAVGVAQTIKSQMFMYVIETRGSYGAPVNVDLPPNSPPAPFVSEDSVWATIIYTLDSAITNLQTGVTDGANFSFPLPSGYSNFNTPQSFQQFTYALLSKAYCFRATVTNPPNASYYTSALTALNSSFFSLAGNFTNGVYYNYSSGAGDTPNNLSEPLTGNTFYADTFNITDAQKQVGGVLLDQRVLSKIDTLPVGTSPGGQGGIPMITGNYKFSVYFVNGTPNSAAPIPIIRNEELILLQAEALLGTGNIGGAVADLNIIREQAGNLPAYGGAMTTAAVTNELLYNRRYSLLWEQGARWIDARRFGLIAAPPPTGIQLGWDTATAPGPPVSWPTTGVPPNGGFSAPNVPTRMPIPNTECLARGLGSTCNPLGT